jgi:hypothetical protein
MDLKRLQARVVLEYVILWKNSLPRAIVAIFGGIHLQHAPEHVFIRV